MADNLKSIATGSDDDSTETHSAGIVNLNEKVCQPCYREGTKQEVLGYCIDCQEFLCGECFRFHRKPAPSRHHVLLDKDQIQHQTAPLHIKDVCMDTCPKHKDEIMKYFCANHATLACSVCMTLLHKECKDTQYIPEAARDYVKSEEVVEFEKQLREVSEESSTYMDRAQGAEALIDNMGKHSLEELSKWKRKMYKAISEIERNVKEYVDNIQKTDKDALNETKERYKTAKDEIKALVNKTETLKNNGQNCQMFVTIKTMKNTMTQVRDKVEEAEKNFKVTKYLFKANPSLEELLQKTNGVGSITSTQTALKTCHVRDISVNTQADDKVCNIGCIVAVISRDLIITDYKNHNVKLVDVDMGTTTTTLELSSGPWGLAALSDDKYAVTLPDDKKLVVITQKGKDLKLVKEIQSNRQMFGLVSYGNNRMIVTLFGKIEIIDINGDTLQTLYESQTLEIPLHVSYNENEYSIYVSDHKLNTVIKLSKSGKILGRYTDNDFEIPGQVLVNRDGTTFVCGVKSNNIHVLSVFCEKSGILLDTKDGIDIPKSIAYCESSNMLYIGGQGNKIKEFSLS